MIEPVEPVFTACRECLVRTWTIRRLSGHLDVARGRALALLELDDHVLIRAVAGRQRFAVERERAAVEPEGERAAAASAGLSLVCRCAAGYPSRLLELRAPPAVLHIAGEPSRFLRFSERDPVAIVGTRDPTPYGAEVAAMLGRQLAGAGVAVVSGMARGIDAAVHTGALEADRRGWGGTIAVVPGSPDRPYPRGKRALHGALLRDAVVIGELGPGAAVRRWMFPARNRIIAALADLAIVVEAGERSGALLTARLARELGRRVGAVPGRVTTLQAAGSNGLLASGAAIIRGAQDALDELFGAGMRELVADPRPTPSDAQAAVLCELDRGRTTAEALVRAGLGVQRGLAELAALELAGRLRRGPGGQYVVIP